MKKCVLIYDDDQEITFLCKIILENDYHVETLTFCDHIIDDIYRIKPGLILMDLWIPEIGGEKAVKIMKSNPQTESTPVILFSANNEIDVISRNIGANGYISKPFDVPQFKGVIKNHIL